MSEDKKTGPKAWYEDFHIKQELQMYYTSYLSRALPDEDAEIYVARVRNSPQRVWRELKAIGEEIRHSEEAANHKAGTSSGAVHKPVVAMIAPEPIHIPEPAVTVAPVPVLTAVAEPTPTVVPEPEGIRKVVEKNMTKIIIAGVVIIALTQYFKA